MVFNVLARNRDDHPKNHAFMMMFDGRWTLTPAYDLTLSAGPGGEHSLAVGGEGRDPEHKHVMARSEAHTSELQSLMRISYAVFCLKKKTNTNYLNTKLDQRQYQQHNCYTHNNLI